MPSFCEWRATRLFSNNQISLKTTKIIYWTTDPVQVEFKHNYLFTLNIYVIIIPINFELHIDMSTSSEIVLCPQAQTFTIFIKKTVQGSVWNYYIHWMSFCRFYSICYWITYFIVYPILAFYNYLWTVNVLTCDNMV